MIQGSWVGDPLPVSFFGPSFYFLFYSFSPIRASIAWVEVDCFAVCPDPFFLRSCFLSFLGIIACQPRGSGIKYMSNK